MDDSDVSTFKFNFPSSSVVALNINGQTVNIPDWGTAPAGLTISHTLQGDGNAPAYARFSISNLATAGFQYPTNHASSIVWNKYLHDLIIKWTVTETSYTYDKLVNIRPSWNAPSIMWGPEPAHCFLEDGTSHNVRVDVWDMYGNHDYGETTVNIRAASEDYDASNTYVLTDDADWTGAPSHDTGNRTTTWEGLLDALQAHSTAEKCRGFIKGGRTFAAPTGGYNIAAGFTNLYLSNYPGFGTGRPIVTHGDHVSAFKISPDLFTREQVAVLKGLEVNGPWDGALETGLADRDRPAMVDHRSGGTSIVTDCVSDGMANGQRCPGGNSVFSMFHNTTIDNFMNYGIYMAGDADGHLAVLGTRVAHKTDNYSGGGGDDNEGQQHGPVRIQNVDDVYFDVFEGFSTASNDRAGNTPPHAAVIRDHRNKLPSTKGSGPIGTFTRMCLEGGSNPLSAGPAASATDRPTNRLFDMVEWIPAGAVSEALWGGPASTFRNFAITVPDSDSLLGGFTDFLGRGSRQYLEVADGSSFAVGETITGGTSGSVAEIVRISGTDLFLTNSPEPTGDFIDGETITGDISGSSTATKELDKNWYHYVEPFEMHQFSLINLRSVTNPTALLEDDDGAERHFAPTLRDYVRHVPNATTAYTGDAPLTETHKTWFRPRSQGSKWQNWDNNMSPLSSPMTYETGIAGWSLDYDGGTGAFAEREQITDGTTGATANIQRIDGDATSGTLYLQNVSGTFGDNNTLTGDASGAAVVNGTLTEVGASDYEPASGSAAFETGTAFGGGTRVSRFNIDMEVRDATSPNKGAF